MSTYMQGQMSLITLAFFLECECVFCNFLHFCLFVSPTLATSQPSKISSRHFLGFARSVKRLIFSARKVRVVPYNARGNLLGLTANSARIFIHPTSTRDCISLKCLC